MRNIGTVGCVASMALLASMTEVAAQGRPPGWSSRLEAETIYRGARDIDGGGDFSASRTILGFGLSQAFGGRNSVSLGFSGGTTVYDFDDTTDPWGRIDTYSLATPIILEVGEAGTAVIVPIARYGGESGVAFDDGLTGGVIAAASWRFSDTLTIGPGLGVFTTLEGGGEYDVFPILLIDWKITDRLSVGNGDGFGASQGPGIGVKYQLRDNLSTQLFVRFDNTEFRLDDDGPAPGGIGRDKVTSVVATAAYQPSRNIDITGFAGAELGGQLTLKDANGDTVEKRDYDPAPILGAKISFRFANPFPWTR
jgi:hypothetical protein